jgi:hypothetical protein
LHRFFAKIFFPIIYDLNENYSWERFGRKMNESVVYFVQLLHQTVITRKSKAYFKTSVSKFLWLESDICYLSTQYKHK